eukprot:1143563-Pelagomonas_calceolata.AAC.3
MPAQTQTLEKGSAAAGVAAAAAAAAAAAPFGEASKWQGQAGTRGWGHMSPGCASCKVGTAGRVVTSTCVESARKSPVQAKLIGTGLELLDGVLSYKFMACEAGHAGHAHSGYFS